MNTDLWNRFHAFLDLLRSPDTRDLLPSNVVRCVFNDPDTVKVQVKLSAYFGDDLNILYKSQGRKGQIRALCDLDYWRQQLLDMGVSFDDQLPSRRLMTFDITGAGVPANLRAPQNLEDDFALAPIPEQRRSSRQRRTSTLYGSQEGYGQESIMSTTRAHRIQRQLQPHRNYDIEPVLEPQSHPSLLQHAASLSENGQESIMSTTSAHRIQRQPQPHRNSEPVLQPQIHSHPSLLHHAASLSDRDICRMYGIYF
jgi:hypothetical protein